MLILHIPYKVVIGIDTLASDETKMSRGPRFPQIPELIIRMSLRVNI